MFPARARRLARRSSLITVFGIVIAFLSTISCAISARTPGALDAGRAAFPQSVAWHSSWCALIPKARAGFWDAAATAACGLAVLLPDRPSRQTPAETERSERRRFEARVPRPYRPPSLVRPPAGPDPLASPDRLFDQLSALHAILCFAPDFSGSQWPCPRRAPSNQPASASPTRIFTFHRTLPHRPIGAGRCLYLESFGYILVTGIGLLGVLHGPRSIVPLCISVSHRRPRHWLSRA